MRLEELHLPMRGVLLLENETRYRSSDTRPCCWSFWSTMDQQVSMEEQVADPRSTSENVMTVFSSFQKTFNNEQDIREVGILLAQTAPACL